jgi:hypothetical protein
MECVYLYQVDILRIHHTQTMDNLKTADRKLEEQTEEGVRVVEGHR